MQQLDDADLDLVAALQLAPRAPLNTIAEVLGTSASTVGRRMQRLQESRLLRFISTVHWSLLTTGNPYVVWIKCEPGTTSGVAAAIQQVREAQSILITSGDADIYCTIYPLSGTDLRRLLTHTLPAIPGIASIQAHLVLRAARQAVAWHLNRLTDAQAAALREHVDADPNSPPDRVGPLTEAESNTLRLLFDDGRISAAQAARELDVSRSTAYRLIQSVLEQGAARPRVEIEPAVLGFPLTALITLDVQPRHIPTVLAALRAGPSGRFTVMTAGPAPITHHAVFRDEEHLSRFVTDDLGALPGIDGLNMSTALAVLRRQWIDRDNDVFLGERIHEVLPPTHPR
ncbi:Lrp/AsnC family transcriptional regulator [Goodfellowiella coeruleoviolacea]|uniref:DNA-binding transcriptional regulator, Lrp family n=1 Tax=Goodfellowiella coeruleoviolacea TaxID=334858 RepID=A0AAE3G820_9PSEU|nr:Lrp/AsnC ligand binding domain-containing protein [Goodfellowiella coeruleoviolacea]MCP2163270.1 DNA-binding transcriptional regulator, Lrp family [Goodfellowiella coeruleoviolacea]